MLTSIQQNHIPLHKAAEIEDIAQEKPKTPRDVCKSKLPREYNIPLPVTVDGQYGRLKFNNVTYVCTAPRFRTSTQNGEYTTIP